MAEQTKQSFFTYKDRPLVRSGDTIYYGSMKDKYVALLQVQSHTEKDGLELADTVTIQMMHTDPMVNPLEMVVKKAEKKGLYAALDIASIWLDRAGGE